MATGFNVNSNISSMKTYRAFAHSQTKLEESIERLSTGLRINKASDDTEGAAIATRLSNRVRSLQKAQTNSKRTIDMLQTAEGSLNDIHNILARMRELAVQSASDNLNTKDRSTIDMEYQQLKSEIDRIAKSTEYNQIKLIDGSQKATVSTVAGVGIDSVSTAGHGGQKVSSGSYSFEYKPGSLKLVNKTTGELEVVDFTPASAGEIKTYQFSSLGLTVSFDEEFDLNNVANSTFEVTATGSTVQIGADDDADSNLDFTLGDATAKGLRLSQSSLDNLAGAQAAISTLDAAIEAINDDRSFIGATQNRLEFTATNADSTIVNLKASISTIRDVDYAKEAMELAKYQILVQSGSAMMVQANQISQTVLQLMQQ